jgi:hypothetical protein
VVVVVGGGGWAPRQVGRGVLIFCGGGAVAERLCTRQSAPRALGEPHHASCLAFCSASCYLVQSEPPGVTLRPLGCSTVSLASFLACSSAE